MNAELSVLDPAGREVRCSAAAIPARLLQQSRHD